MTYDRWRAKIGATSCNRDAKQLRPSSLQHRHEDDMLSHPYTAAHRRHSSGCDIQSEGGHVKHHDPMHSHNKDSRRSDKK